MTSYLKKFYSIYGILTSLAGAIPFIGKLGNIKYITPPIEMHFLFLFLFFFVTLIFLTYFLRNSKLLKHSGHTFLMMVSLFLIAFIAFLLYFLWCQKAVRSIKIESLNKTDSVIVGTERTPFAEEKYPDFSDEEMLRDGGYKADDIRRLWTPASLSRSHLHIVGSYFTMILLLTEILSIGVLKLVLDEQETS